MSGIASDFIYNFASMVDFLFGAYMWIIIGRALISWVNPDPYNPIVKFLREVTDPVLNRIRRYIPLAAGGIDFSPMILIAAIIFMRGFLVATLQRLAVTLG